MIKDIKKAQADKNITYTYPKLQQISDRSQVIENIRIPPPPIRILVGSYNIATNLVNISSVIGSPVLTHILE